MVYWWLDLDRDLLLSVYPIVEQLQKVTKESKYYWGFSKPDEEEEETYQ